jgi:hypothetical protein
MSPFFHASRRPSAFLPVGLALCFFCSGVVSRATPVTGWQTHNGTISAGDTGHPVFERGAVAVSAALDTPAPVAGVGDTLVLRGKAAFKFPDSVVGLDAGFRWGLFSSNNKTGNDGWSGYMVLNKRAGAVALYKKNGGRFWNSTAEKSGYLPVRENLAGHPGRRPLSSGTYEFTLRLERQADGLRVSWSLVSSDTGYALEGSWLDTAPVIRDINRVMLQATSNFGHDSIAFSGLELAAADDSAGKMSFVPASAGEGTKTALSSRQRNQARLDASLPDFPKPDPAARFRESKIYDRQDRFYRIPSDNWAAALRLVRNDSEWTTWLAGRRDALDDWMQKRRDNIAWRAGWGHFFISPKDGSYLTFTPDEPVLGGTLSSPTDPTVEVTPKILAAWVTKFRQAHIEKILESARFFRLTGEQKYFDWAVAQIDFYASGYAQITPYESGILKGKLFGNLLNDATTLVQMSQAAFLIWDHVPEKKKSHWQQNYFFPEACLLDDGFPCPINIACWQRSAQGLVALLYNDEALWKEVVDGREGIRRQLGRGVTSDYFWFEQSLGYNYYVVDALLPFFEEVARRGRMDEIRDEAAILENLILAPLELRFPNGFFPNPADVTGRMQASRVRERLARVAHLFPTTVGCHAAGKIKDWATLLNPPSSDETDAPPPEFPVVESRAFESTRFVVLKNDPWQVFIHFGQVDLNHAQAEAPGFEACYGRLPVTLDPGTVAYSSPLYKSYYKAGLADNVPLVNGLPQSSWRPGSLLSFDARENRAVVAQHPYVTGWNATREFHIDGGNLADRLTLEPASPATSSEAAVLGFLLHFENNASLATHGRTSLAGFAPEPDFATGRLDGFKNWAGVKRGDARDEARFALTIDGRPFDLVIRTEGAFRIHVATTPGYPPGKRTSLLVEKIAPKGAKGVFETVISPASNK